jgi:S1-C subfamily serine protease
MSASLPPMVHQSVAPRAPPSRFPPPVPSMLPAPPPTPGKRLALALAVALGLLAGILVAVLVARRVLSRGGRGAGGVARIVLSTHAGTGFFVKGPDASAYLVTANHVVDSGERILVERTVTGSGGRQWIEAYPDAEVVAFDADADLAIVRLQGVAADAFPALDLAAEPVADEAILSYGFPASSLASRSGMVSKPGKILSLVKFPVVDRRTGEILRNDAVDGLLVSSEIEPGFSGGPTCNDKGEVVGVNVTKDTVHRAQNGAVAVSAVRKLLSAVKPRARTQEADPGAADVKALVARIQSEYLLLPVERRWTAREQDYVSSGDLPRLEELISTMRRLENDTTRDDQTKLSGQAMLGVALARLPGRPLETYTDPSTRKALGDCELRARSLREFFGALVPHGGDADALAATADGKCGALAFRPLVWDMTALALRWEGKEREVTVGKIESVDPERHVYRASTRFEGIDHVVDLWLATDGGRLRLKLFDAEGRPAGMSAVQETPASQLTGTWRRSEPRAAHDFGGGVDADSSTDETLVVSIGTDGTSTVTHQVKREVTFTGRRRPACGGVTLDLGLEQSFSGPLHDGAIVGFRQKDARPLGRDMARCWSLFTYAPDQVAVLKRVGDKLLMYRTDGVVFPEAAEFER